MSGGPDRSPRRRFLAGVVGGATLAATGATSVAVIGGTTDDERWGGLVEYRGLRRLGGPADRPLPQVPVRVDDEGYLHGRFPRASGAAVPATTLGGVRYSAEWFRYCEGTEHPGLLPGAEQDTYLRTARDTPYDWQRAAMGSGERLHVSAFDDHETWDDGIGTPGVGKPAMATWRSRGLDRTIHVQVLRSGRVERMAARGGDWLRAATDDGFLAWVADCTNRCAVTALRAYDGSEHFDAGDLAYCPRHQSTFDPFDVVPATFAAPEWRP